MSREYRHDRDRDYDRRDYDRRDRYDDRRDRDRYDDRRDRFDSRRDRDRGYRYRDERPSCSLLVRNITPRVRSEEIKQIMERLSLEWTVLDDLLLPFRYGDVRDVYIPLDYYTKASRGFAFVEFRDSRDARFQASLTEIPSNKF